MPFNGSGVFQRVRNWVADATAGIKIRADYHDAEDDGFAAGLSNTITKDGQTLITQNIPFNNKRVTGLADPINPQDASTKAYADTKMPLSGGTFSGPLTVTGNLSVNGAVWAYGYRTRTGVSGAFGGNYYNFNWDGNLQAYVDDYYVGPLATHAFANTAASNAAAGKINRSGDSMGGLLSTAGSGGHIAYGSDAGALQVMGAGGGNHAFMSFHRPGAFATHFGLAEDSNFYMGGWSYGEGQWFRFWTTRDFANVPSSGTVADGRLAFCSNHSIAAGGQGQMENCYEPFGGAVIVGWSWTNAGGYPYMNYFKLRWMQLQAGGNWYTVGTSG